jgi:hypothetical protein
MSANDAPLLGIAPAHVPALVALLFLPFGVALAMRVVRWADEHGVGAAVRLSDGYTAAPLAVRVAASLLLASGVVHVALAFGHHSERSTLFLLDGVGLMGLTLAALTTTWWRPVAAALLIANMIAYTVLIGMRQEAADQLGIAVKLAELTALALVLSPRGLAVRRRALAWGAMAAVFPLCVAVGGTAWIVSVTHAAEGAGHVHAAGSVHDHRRVHDLRHALVEGRTPDGTAAERLVAETRAWAARYATIEAAYADGYRDTRLTGGDTPHIEHRGHMRDGRVLDPAAPEQLVYVRTGVGLILAGVVYVMPRAGQRGPAVGAADAHWHTHTLCITPAPLFIAGLMPPTGHCPPGSVNAVLPEMIHVWLVDNPGGPFADGLEKAYVERLKKGE